MVGPDFAASGGWTRGLMGAFFQHLLEDVMRPADGESSPAWDKQVIEECYS